jgi:hypothetical protein
MITHEVTVANGYPSFNCFIKWDVHNTGTIPIHIYRPTTSTAASTWERYQQRGAARERVAAGVLDGRDAARARAGCFLHLHIHPNQGAEELANYTFQVRFSRGSGTRSYSRPGGSLPRSGGPHWVTVRSEREVSHAA